MVDDGDDLSGRTDHEALDLSLLLGRVGEAVLEGEPGCAHERLLDIDALEDPGTQRTDNGERLVAHESAGQSHRDPGMAGELRCDAQAVRHDSQVDPASAGLEVTCQCKGCRAGVERDALSVDHHRGSSRADGVLLARLEPFPDLEGSFGSLAINGDGAAVRTNEPALGLECEEVLPDRHGGNVKRGRELGDAGAAVLLHDPCDVLLALPGEDISPCAWSLHRCGHPLFETPTGAGNRPAAVSRSDVKGTPIAMSTRNLKGIERAHASLGAAERRLGADPRTTNYAGGNTSAKGNAVDPVTGQDIAVLWVKGSGGDLGTLTEAGLAVLRLDRLRDLADVYPGVDREDEMVAAFEHCLFGRGGAAPSIDTAMHALLGSAHVDHLHPDSGIAFATAAAGAELTRAYFDDRVAWVPWRRPGFQLGLDIAAIQRDHPDAIGVVLGGHGITAWGRTSDECEANSLEIIRTAERYIDEHGRAEPFGQPVPEYAPLPEAERKERAAALLPFVRGLASTDRPQVGHYNDSEAVLDFLSHEAHPRLAALGTSCPDHFLRTKIRPLVLDLPGSAPLDEIRARLSELHSAYRDEYRAYYGRHATSDSPAMRGADPAIVLIPGVGMLSFGAKAQTARVAGEFYVNAINVMRGAEAISLYAPISESEKFRIEYWRLEEDKLARLPKPKPLATRISLVTGGGSGIGRAIAHRLAAEGACVIVADIDAANAETVAREIGGLDVARSVTCDVTDEDQIATAVRDCVLAFGGLDIVINNAGLSISRPLLETTVQDWDLQHDVMARGSFLVSREATRVMIEQNMRGDIVYIASKNALFAGPNNVAYGAAKADQAHQVRLLAAELGQYSIRVNGINPDGVVRGSGIFAKGWGADRARTYGIPEDKLGEFYAQRTLLKREVLPEHVAAAVFALVGGDLSLTTGLHIPVDAGVAAAFLR